MGEKSSHGFITISGSGAGLLVAGCYKVRCTACMSPHAYHWPHLCSCHIERGSKCSGRQRKPLLSQVHKTQKFVVPGPHSMNSKREFNQLKDEF